MKKQLLVLTAFFSVFGNSMNAGWSLSGSSAVSKTISKAIVNPETGRRVSIYGKIGKKVLNSYIQAGGR